MNFIKCMTLILMVFTYVTGIVVIPLTAVLFWQSFKKNKKLKQLIGTIFFIALGLLWLAVAPALGFIYSALVTFYSNLLGVL